jgi:membrane-associated protease RseP (regulator of RpoE activity)
MVSLLAVFAGLSAAYIALLVWAGRSGSERFEVVGPLLMLRTEAGKGLIDRISKRRWLGTLADVFIVLTVLAGLAMVVLVVWQNTLLFTHTEEVRQNPPEVEQTLAIPGVNPAIPVGYGLFALIVALVIHEGGHGVMARFANLKVKSLGLLFLVVPVGAFVEPDETELQGATLRDKLRMFAAGPGPNMVLGAITLLLFAQVFVPAMAPAHDEGVAILNVQEGGAADQAGLEPGDLITSVEGIQTDDTLSFSRVLDHHGTTALPDGAKFTGTGDEAVSLAYNVTVPEDAEGSYEIAGEHRFQPSMDERADTPATTIDVACPATGVTTTNETSTENGTVTRQAPREVGCGQSFTVDVTVDPPEGERYWLVTEQLPDGWEAEGLVGGLARGPMEVTYLRDDETRTTTVEPKDKHESFLERTGGPVPDSFRGVPFFGVSPSDAEGLNSITDRLEDPLGEEGLRGALFYLALPFLQLQPFPSAFHDLFTVTGFLGQLGTWFWITANSLYWLFWINVVLGTFNALPLGPLDGGHMFRRTAHWWYRRDEGIEGDDLRVFHTEEGGPTFVGRTQAIQDQLDAIDGKVKLVNRTVGITLLVLVLAPLIVPNFL